MKIYRLFAVLAVIFGLVFASCSDEIPEVVPVVDDTPFDINDYLPIIEEVARMIDYDDLFSNQPNLYKGDNEFQGRCGDYALAFAVKTGAYIVDEGSIWKIIGEDKNHRPGYGHVNKYGEPVGYSYLTDTINNGWNNKGFYSCVVGAYITEHVDMYHGNSYIGHAWNMIKGVDIDVTRFDAGYGWRH